MNFEQQIFEQVQGALPNTTTRTFSTDCGMSENYFCSIRSQGLQISTAAIVHLAEVLEHRSELGQITKPIEPILKLIADEIAKRSQSTQSASVTVQKIIASAAARIAFERDSRYNIPPIVMGW